MKPLRLKIVIADGMVNIDTETTNYPGDFVYASLCNLHGLQANHENPEWPEMRDKLSEVSRLLVDVYKIYNGAACKLIL